MKMMAMRIGKQFFSTGRIVACAFAATLMLSIFSGRPASADTVTLTPIGSPTWQPGDFHFFTAPVGDFDDGFAEIGATQAAILPPSNHLFNAQLGGPGPGVPHGPPYDHEMGEGITNAGFTFKSAFKTSDFDLPNGVWLACTFVPSTNAPTGTSPDFDSGPIIPNSLLPITQSGVLTRNGTLFDPNIVGAIPVLNTITNPLDNQLFNVDGWSHVPWFVIESSVFGPPDTPSAGNYQYHITYLDSTTTNGWDVVATFSVGLDLAITSIKAPKTIALTATKPSQTKFVIVQMQNVGQAIEVITNFNDVVALEIDSTSSNCPSLTPVLLDVPPQKTLPLSVKPKAKFNVIFSVTYSTNCVPDAAKSTRTDDHSDYTYTATIPQSDNNSTNNVCPRLAVTDSSGKVIDKGCGGKSADRTVLTDVTVK
jgi:hypothetical protein